MKLPYLALALCLPVAGLVSAASTQDDSSSSEAAALTVTVVKPQERDWARTIPASGWLAAWHEAVIAAETGGLRITDVLVDVGSVVTKGQELVRLSRDSVLADLHEQEAAVASAKASLAQARANADRARKVKGSGALSDQEVNEYLITEQTAQATLASEEAGLQSQRIKLDQTIVRAADDGIISSRSANLGTVVSSGTELFRLIRQQRVEWQAEVSAQYLSKFQTGATAVIAGPNNGKIEGKVRLIGPTVSTDSSRATVYVELPKSAGTRVGVYATGSIELGHSPALTVPETALVFRDGINYVFTLNEKNRVARTRVDIGRRQGTEVEVLSGLAANSQVVESGGAFLSDDVLVNVEKASQ